jgi:hypothetical protein
VGVVIFISWVGCDGYAKTNSSTLLSSLLSKKE